MNIPALSAANVKESPLLPPNKGLHPTDAKIKFMTPSRFAMLGVLCLVGSILTFAAAVILSVTHYFTPLLILSGGFLCLSLLLASKTQREIKIEELTANLENAIKKREEFETKFPSVFLTIPANNTLEEYGKYFTFIDELAEWAKNLPSQSTLDGYEYMKKYTIPNLINYRKSLLELKGIDTSSLKNFPQKMVDDLKILQQKHFPKAVQDNLKRIQDALKELIEKMDLQISETKRSLELKQATIL